MNGEGHQHQHASQSQTSYSQPYIRFKHLGGTHLLDGVWQRLGIAAGLEKLLSERG